MKIKKKKKLQKRKRIEKRNHIITKKVTSTFNKVGHFEVFKT